MARLTADDLDIERPDEPFEYETADGTVFEFLDPGAINLRALIDLEQGSPVDQLRAMVPAFDEFAGKPDVNGRVFAAVLKAYYQHFGLGAPGESVASPSSANGTARRSKPTSRSAASTSRRSSNRGASGTR